MKRALFVAGALLVAFGVGYVPQYLNVSRLSSELDATEQRYAVQIAELEWQNGLLQLQRDLGVLLLEVEDLNYGRARDRSTMWFDQLAEMAAGSRNEATRQTLTTLSGRRDRLTSLLAAASSDAVIEVRQMYRQLAAASPSN